MEKFILYAYGLACVSMFLARAEILEYPKIWILKKIPRKAIHKEVDTLLHCSMCIGFWVGLGGSALVLCGAVPPFWLSYWTSVALSPFVVSMTAIIIDKLIFKKSNVKKIGRS